MKITLANLSEYLQLFVENEMAEQGYPSPDAYVRALLLREAQRKKIISVKRKSIFGKYSHLGFDVTEAEIDDARRQAWEHFAREIS